jgi:hypothetical protein
MPPSGLNCSVAIPLTFAPMLKLHFRVLPSGTLPAVSDQSRYEFEILEPRPSGRAPRRVPITSNGPQSRWRSFVIMAKLVWSLWPDTNRAGTVCRAPRRPGTFAPCSGHQVGHVRRVLGVVSKSLTSWLHEGARSIDLKIELQRACSG